MLSVGLYELLSFSKFAFQGSNSVLAVFELTLKRLSLFSVVLLRLYPCVSLNLQSRLLLNLVVSFQLLLQTLDLGLECVNILGVVHNHPLDLLFVLFIKVLQRALQHLAVLRNYYSRAWSVFL